MADEDLQSRSPVYFFNPDDSWQAFMSQWFEDDFKDDKNAYTSAEMYMMYQKAILFGDTEIAEQILKADTPKKQKALGRDVRNFDRKIWDQNKFDIVERGNYLKFSQCKRRVDDKETSLKELLLMTDDRELIETYQASPFDRIWGIGFSSKDAPHTPREKWGENLLGKALMKVRDALRAENDAMKMRR